MFKRIVLVIVFPTLALANVTDLKELAAEQNLKPVFISYGRICSGPSIDQNGDMVTSRRYQAERLADEAASKHCYPFQFKQLSSYYYRDSNEECHSTNSHTIRESVSAEYRCAGIELSE